jgi:UDP-glucose 4-epimerase
VHPHTEDEPLRPGSDYARLKATIEGILAADPRCRIARLANVYGPGMSPQNIFSAILAQVGGSGPIMVRDLAPVRDYVDARDVARGLADLALVPAQPGAYNLSTGRGTSVEKLARLVSPRPVVDTAPSNRSSTLILSPEKARHVLGWAPAYTLEAGVRDLLKATA